MNQDISISVYCLDDNLCQSCHDRTTQIQERRIITNIDGNAASEDVTSTILSIVDEVSDYADCVNNTEI